MSPDTHPEIHNRLDRMEASLSGSLEKLTAAVEKLVVLETKHHETITTLARYGAKLDKHDERIDTIEKKMPLIEKFMDRADKVSLAVIISVTVAGIAAVLSITYG